MTIKKDFFYFTLVKNYEKYELIQRACLFYLKELINLISKEKNEGKRNELSYKRNLILELKFETQDFILEKYKPYIKLNNMENKKESSNDVFVCFFCHRPNRILIHALVDRSDIPNLHNFGDELICDLCINIYATI